MRVTDSILVSVDFDVSGRPDVDTAVLVVGKKKKGDGIYILNAFQGEEAMELYKKLTGNGKEEK